MANQTMLIVNPTAVAYSNVNAANEDIPAYSAGVDGTYATCVLSDAEQATFAAAHASALMILCAGTHTAASLEIIRKALKIAKLGKFPATATS